MQSCEWTQEALTSSLMLNHRDELVKHGVIYKMDVDTIELPPEI